MKKRILVVDDDIDVQEQMRIILEESGFDTVLAGSAAGARDILGHEAIDLILLDVMMEKDSAGFEFAQKIKSDEETMNIPIIMVTSVNRKTAFHFDPETDGAFLPVEKFIEKPIRPEEVLSAVGEYI